MDKKLQEREEAPWPPAAPCPSVDEPVLDDSHIGTHVSFVSWSFGGSRFRSGETATVFHRGRSGLLPAGQGRGLQPAQPGPHLSSGLVSLRHQLTVGSVSMSLVAEHVLMCVSVVRPTAMQKCPFKAAQEFGPSVRALPGPPRPPASRVQGQDGPSPKPPRAPTQQPHLGAWKWE